MKPFFFLLFHLACLLLHAQKGNELLVYSLTGNVTLIENNQATKLKIGKVLKPGATIKTERQAKLTMVCKEGKPISVSKEGSFPVTRWNDSCKTESNSVTTKYFQYIWDQLYVRSDDYKKSNQPGGIPEAPIRGQDELEILLVPGLDTLHYAGGFFWLSWTTNKPYKGGYLFSLYSLKTRKLVFKDSVRDGINTDLLKKYMRAGNNYYWTVSTKETGEVDGGVIYFHSKANALKHINKLKKMVSVPEDAASQNLRVAYLLEKTGYTADAMVYYQKAASFTGETDFYKEMLIDFRKKFNLTEPVRN